MKKTVNLQRRPHGGGHTTSPRNHSHLCFPFDDSQHRRGAINGEVWVSRTCIGECGRPVSITINFPDKED